MLRNLHCYVVVMTLFSVLLIVKYTHASVGDKSYVFNRCLNNEVRKKCKSITKFVSKQPLEHRLLGWTCVDEYRYQCMWKTVKAYEKDGMAIPQFYGKWPFIRMLGIQEPASTVFSLLNLFGHLGIFMYQRKIPSSAPMYYIWNGQALIGFNAWMSSTVFHTRDVDLTEKLDYFGAFSLVLYGFFIILCRWFSTYLPVKSLCTGILLLAVYMYHIGYLLFIEFDYGYNMKVNLFFGVSSLVLWLGWCLRHRRQQRYVWKCAVVIICLNVFVLLEVFDFPPVWWMFDAHSLWHASTIPLAPLWYSFMIDDSKYVLSKEDEANRSINTEPDSTETTEKADQSEEQTKSKKDR